MLLRAGLANARRRPTENPHSRLSNQRFVRFATAVSLSYVLSLPLPAQRQIRTSLRLTHTHLCNQRLLRSSASLRHNGAIVKFRPFRLANTSRVGLHSGLRTCSCEIKDFYVAIVELRPQFAVACATPNSDFTPAYA